MLPLFSPKRNFLAISYENDTKHQNSYEISNVARFAVLNCFLQDRPFSHIFEGKCPFRVILNIFQRYPLFGVNERLISISRENTSKCLKIFD